MDGRALFRKVAPRLERAHRERREEEERHRRKRRSLVNALHHKEKNFAHRELQLIRAGDVGKRGYVESRSRKLAQAQRELDRAREALARFDGTR